MLVCCCCELSSLKFFSLSCSFENDPQWKVSDTSSFRLISSASPEACRNIWRSDSIPRHAVCEEMQVIHFDYHQHLRKPTSASSIFQTEKSWEEFLFPQKSSFAEISAPVLSIDSRTIMRPTFKPLSCCWTHSRTRNLSSVLCWNSCCTIRKSTDLSQ